MGRPGGDGAGPGQQVARPTGVRGTAARGRHRPDRPDAGGRYGPAQGARVKGPAGIRGPVRGAREWGRAVVHRSDQAKVFSPNSRATGFHTATKSFFAAVASALAETASCQALDPVTAEVEQSPDTSSTTRT